MAISLFFFFNDTATTEIYTLSLHDALPICELENVDRARLDLQMTANISGELGVGVSGRSEEHTSELQSQSNLVCRLLLEKKKESNSFARQRVQSSHARMRGAKSTAG